VTDGAVPCDRSEVQPFGLSPDPAVTTLLVDLDGTLVRINQRVLARGLLLAGARRFASVVPPWRFRSMYVRALDAARANATSKTNHEVFIDFLRQHTRRPERVAGLVEEFVETDLANLRTAFSPMPDARGMLVAARAMGYKLVLATNPLWPLAAVRLRLSCAGLGDIAFSYIAHSEVSTRCKPGKDYYEELLRRASAPAAHCVMIGNDPEKDAPAVSVGIKTVLLAGDRVAPADNESALLTYATLPQVHQWLLDSCRLQTHGDLR
jgi:FMN phosphatase YigB (HAD superfamily)